MDISCDVMFTEISPINSFLQRVGRCARFSNEFGEVYVCDVQSLEEKDLLPEGDADGQNLKEIKRFNNKYLPYNKELCYQSLAALEKYNYLDEQIVLELLNSILREPEKKIINNILEVQYNWDKIRESWSDCDKKHYRETISDIQSMEIVLLDLENVRDNKVQPWEYETLSVYKWSFIGWANSLSQNKNDDNDWVFAKAEQRKISQFDFDWQDKEPYFLERLKVSELRNHFDVVFVDNRYFDYSSDIGLLVRINDNGVKSPIKALNLGGKERISFKKDTFYQHSKAVINCSEILFGMYFKFIFKQLDEYWKQHVDWSKLIKLMMCLHDYGKLNDAWLKPMLKFQRKKSNNENYFEFLAHTDYDEVADADFAKECGIDKKPPHAGIGAMQIYEILYDDYGESIARSVATAILKHHNIYSKSFVSYSIGLKGKSEIMRLVKEYGWECDFIPSERGESLDDILPQKDKNNEMLLYLLFVRILRLSDQQAAANFEKYYNI